MSILFTPFKLGNLQLRNRFVFSACEDNLASEDGAVTESTLKKNATLARGEVGLIISSHMAVHPSGRTRIHQTGIYADNMIAGLKALARSVHEHEGKIIFQLGHSGAPDKSNTGGQKPADSYAVNSMNEDNLSPYFNHREDSWGGCEENRFRLLKEIILAVKNVLPAGMPLLVKLNSNDYTRTQGITPSLAVDYAKRLADIKIDGLEISCGTTALSPWHVCRGDIPIQEILAMYDPPARPQIETALKKMQEAVRFAEGYNLEATQMIRPVMGEIPLFAVGGWRNVSSMENAVQSGYTDLISMCRPLIREPRLVRRIREGKTSASSCTNCNKCYMSVRKGIPLRCYSKGLPQ
ncbi:MAG: hypothetical protein NT082_06005 [Chloroflexi bacterium]|nr:hypothetical protein [Chloroflexota bacterium]